MKNKVKKYNKENDGYDWAVMPDTYFAASFLCCDALLNSSFNLDIGARKIIGNSTFKKYGFRSSHPDYQLIYPLIFNFKQGIELYLKGLSGMSVGEVLMIHDIREVFETIIQQTKALSTTNKYDFFVKLHKETWPIIEKYYYGLYIPNHKDYGHPDKMNISERYPRCGEGYDLGDIFSWVTREKIEEVKKDIHTLEKIFAKAKRNNFLD